MRKPRCLVTDGSTGRDRIKACAKAHETAFICSRYPQGNLLQHITCGLPAGGESLGEAVLVHVYPDAIATRLIEVADEFKVLRTDLSSACQAKGQGNDNSEAPWRARRVEMGSIAPPCWGVPMGRWEGGASGRSGSVQGDGSLADLLDPGAQLFTLPGLRPRRFCSGRLAQGVPARHRHPPKSPASVSSLLPPSRTRHRPWPIAQSHPLPCTSAFAPSIPSCRGEPESASAQPGTEPAAPMRAAQYARNALPRAIKIGEIWRFLALFRRFSGNQGTADHVSADPARLARSSPGLRSTAQRQHQPHQVRLPRHAELGEYVLHV